MAELATETMTDLFYRVLDENEALWAWDATDVALAELCLRVLEATHAAGGSREDERQAILFSLHQWYEVGTLELADALIGIMPNLVRAVHIYDQARREVRHGTH